MKVLKALGLSLLGILLFFSLLIFSLALTINCTVLSPRYVTSQINHTDFPTLAQEILDENGSDMPAGLQSELLTTVDKIEPLVKNKLSDAVYSVYDYMLGKKPVPELANTLQSTFMNSSFIAALLEDVDITNLVHEFIEQVEDQPEDISLIMDYLDPGLVELEPWIKQQAASAAGTVFAYMLGRTDDFSVSISLAPVKNAVEGVIKEAFLDSPPPSLAGQPRTALSLYYDEALKDLLASLDEPIVINPEFLSEDDPGGAVLTGEGRPLGEAEKALEEVRVYVSYFQLGFWLLLVFILLLIAGIVLIYWQIRGATRDLSIIFLTCGVPALVGVLIARTVVGSLLPQAEMPAYLQAQAVNIYNSALMPYMWYAIGLILIGIALLVVSLVVRPPEEAV
jgi:hypothetical protein